MTPLKRLLAFLKPALVWWRGTFVYRLFWVCGGRRVFTQVLVLTFSISSLLFLDDFLSRPVLELEQMPKTSGVVEKVREGGGRHKRWRIRLRLDDGADLWFDRTHTKSDEPERLQAAEGKRVTIWYQEEYSLLTPFFYRHANQLNSHGEVVLDYGWLLKNRLNYRAAGS
ncbi:MAG: hypothetical protein GY703_14385, partial [Gammaproteobacteria bacterium]|nr:hypothetical protein [Gammaproteobacteria bacterium]